MPHITLGPHHMPIPRIILVGADKGGVGKTTVARVLIDRAVQLGPPPRVVDTETTPGVLKRFYPNAEVLDVRTVAGQMAALDKPAPLTIVDIRAGLLLVVLRALRDAGLLADAARGEIKFVIAHVVGPTYASYSELAAAREITNGAGSTGVLHVVIKNYVSEGQVFEWIEPTASTVLVPHLDDIAATAMDAENVMPETFAADLNKSRILRGNVRHWLDQIYPEVKRVGLEAELAA